MMSAAEKILLGEQEEKTENGEEEIANEKALKYENKM